MIIWFLISILCFFLFRRFTRKIEIRNYGSWEDFKLPLWGWGFIIITALVPVMNILGLLLFELFCIGDSTRLRYGSIRFKEGQSHWLIKLLDILNKEY